MRVDVAECLDVANGVGESPVWDERQGVLRWVDITGRAVLALGPDRAIQRRPMPDFPCFLVLRRVGGAVIGLRDRLCFLDLATGQMAPFCQLEPDRPANRCNEGAVDPAGRLWVGTMQNNLEADGSPRDINRATGALYRIERSGAVERVLDGIGLSNTLAWSPDGGTMLFGDTLTNRIRRYQLDVDGRIVHAACFHDLPLPGACDGSALDVDGYLWNARFGAGRLLRFAPDGRVDCEIPLPVTNPTSCCFGGPDLTTLFVTSARFGLSAAQIDANPHEGALLQLTTDVAGRPACRFAG